MSFPLIELFRLVSRQGTFRIDQSKPSIPSPPNFDQNTDINQGNLYIY